MLGEEILGLAGDAVPGGMGMAAVTGRADEVGQLESLRAPGYAKSVLA